MGKPEVKKAKKAMTFKVPAELHRKLRMVAAQEGKKIEEVAAAALAMYIGSVKWERP